MLELKTPKERAQYAQNMASSFELVHFRDATYVPADFETGDSSYVPPKDRTMWMPLSRQDIQKLAAAQYNMMFGSDSELRGFDFMVAQSCRHVDEPPNCLLVRTPDGLRLLNQDGELVEPTGDFVPNTLIPLLNSDEADKAEVMGVMEEWVGGEEEADSLLTHLATSLAPGYSAVKYVLLLGEGRNGKSTLLKMVQALFGPYNTSHVTRQNIAEQSPAVLDLNGKLVNIVFDGQAEYLKDSGAEKTLIAGEAFGIRKLYESTTTLVQTNALFIEGLQQEPKSKDKSTALQKRLVRFFFPNVYAQNHRFERHMLSERMLGAFMSLLIDRYVKEDEVAERLKPTSRAVELQLEHMYTNSLALQFLKHIEDTDPLGLDVFVNQPIKLAIQHFQSWRLKENDTSGWTEPDVQAQLLPLLTTERKSVRDGGKVVKTRVVTGLKPEAQAFIDMQKGDEDADDTAALVED